jgi:hypothetical protein
MRMADANISASVAPPQVSRESAACEEEEKEKLQRKPAEGGRFLR